MGFEFHVILWVIVTPYCVQTPYKIYLQHYVQIQFNTFKTNHKKYKCKNYLHKDGVTLWGFRTKWWISDKHFEHNNTKRPPIT